MSDATQNLVRRAFSYGELAPALGARADLPLYQMGLKALRNFVIQKQGGVANRTGTRFVTEVKTSVNQTLLYKFVFTDSNESWLFELGDQYLRFYQEGSRVEVVTADLPAYAGATTYAQGDLVKDGGIGYYAKRTTVGDTPASSPDDWYPLAANGSSSIFEIPTPYLAPVGVRPRWTQNGATVVITHPDYPPYLLTNNDPTGNGTVPDWTLSAITFGPGISAPTNLAGSAGAAGELTLRYKATAIKATTYEESLPSSAVTIASAARGTEADPVPLTWDAVAGAAEYRLYCDPYSNGQYGFIGTAVGQASFNDTGFAPDFARTPPIDFQPFGSSSNYPEVATHYQQRRLFARTTNSPATVWGSRIGDLANMSIRSPLQDDDGIQFTLVSRDLQSVRHLIPLKVLVLMMSTGEWLVLGDESSGALVPAAINAKQYAYRGANRIPPAIIGNTIIYVQDRGSTVLDLSFDRDTGTMLGGRDLTIWSGHLFDGYTMLALDYQQTPHSTAWVVRSDGKLLSMTYLADEQQYGWARHDTGPNGAFEDVCVVPEDDGTGAADVVYVLVNRTVNGATKRYIERFKPRPVFTSSNFSAESFFVDCGITRTGASSTSVTGLSHLEGEQVIALGDGVVSGPYVVTGGAITLSAAAAIAHVGLQITAELETLDLDVHGTGIRDKRKRVQAITAIIEASRGAFKAGPDATNLMTHRRELWQSASGLLTGAYEVNMTAGFTEHGRTVVRHTDPTPLTVLGLIPRFEVGG
jgi:hypothetical protein